MTNDHDIQIHLLPLSPPASADAAGLAEAEQNGRTGQRGDHREVQWPKNIGRFFFSPHSLSQMGILPKQNVPQKKETR